MKKLIIFSIALATLSFVQVKAQETPVTKAGKKEMSGPGVKRRATGKISNDATQNGNMNSSDTQVKFTEGSTSQGTASTPTPGGAKGTDVRAARRRKEGDNANVSTQSTSGKTGSQRPTSTAAVEKEANTSDKNVSTGYPQPASVKQPGNAMSPRQKVRANTTRGMGQKPDNR